MEPGSILIVGVGGIGCKWSSRAHGRCQQLSELLLIDADESSFSSEYEAHCLHLDASGSGREQPHCQIWLHIGSTKEWPTSKGC